MPVSLRATPLSVVFTRALLSVLVLCPFLGGAMAAPRKLTVVVWTDIHYGNEKYVAAAWNEAYASGLALHPDVVVMTGDQMDNKCTREEFLQRQDAFLADLNKRLARVKAPVMLVFGNNDFHANYQTDPDVLKPTMDAYHKYMKRFDYLDDLGNGVSPNTVGGMTWISINSQIFSPLNHYAGVPAQAKRTFAFLESTLQRLPKGRPVVLLLHIPPSFDLYDGKLSWQPAYVEQLRAILAAYPGRVVMLGAHYHRNEIHGFQVAGRGAVPMLVSGSISFKYGNYPNWRSGVWTLGTDGTVARLDWVDRYPAHAAWNDSRSLTALYSPATYDALAARWRDNLDAYLHYIENLYAHNADWKKWADDPKTRPMLVEQVLEKPLETVPTR